MPYHLYNYVDAHGHDDFAAWAGNLQAVERAKLNQKIDKLAREGAGLFPHILAGTDVPGILKLRVKGKVQLRPMLCYGPVSIHTEFTFLFGATERDGKLVPKGADRTADDRKSEVIKDSKRRKLNERSPKTTV